MYRSLVHKQFCSPRKAIGSHPVGNGKALVSLQQGSDEWKSLARLSGVVGGRSVGAECRRQELTDDEAGARTAAVSFEGEEWRRQRHRGRNSKVSGPRITLIQKTPCTVSGPSCLRLTIPGLISPLLPFLEGRFSFPFCKSYGARRESQKDSSAIFRCQECCQ